MNKAIKAFLVVNLVALSFLLTYLNPRLKHVRKVTSTWERQTLFNPARWLDKNKKSLRKCKI